MKLFRSPHGPTTRVRAHKRQLRLEVLEDRTLLSGFAKPSYIISHPIGTATPFGTSGPTGYTPSQIRHAYGFDQIALPGGVTGDGSGTTIAIVDAFDDPKLVSSTDPNFNTSDLHRFDVQFQLADPTFKKVNQSGGTALPAPDSGWAQEIALDVEWAHAIAPRASILLVEANDNSFTNLLAAVSYAANQPGVVALSMSWGGGEFSSETSLDSTFLTPSGHSGVTFVASSGDSGAPPIYPAISPNVLAIGGTSLSLDSQGNYISESGWSGSGGGISSVEAQPAYQKGVVTQSSTRRTNPDVAYDSDPNTGVPVYESYNNGSATPWSQFGGTSIAAPQWAALIAIADQGRALAGKGALDGPGQTLPIVYQFSALDFNDIVTGFSAGQPAYFAAPGYDLVTGRGTPIANKIVADLIGNTGTAASTSTGLISSVSPSVYGQSVTFTATVTATAPGTGTPGGTVTFKDGVATLGGGTLNASGVATFMTSSLSAATHSITAVYGGDANFTGSTSTPVSQVVNKAGTDMAITSSVSPSNAGQAVTFTTTVTAHLPGSGTPTGTVTFKDGAASLGTGTLNASGVASLSTSGLTVGNHTITASYGGDGNFKAGTSPALIQVVNVPNPPPTLDPLSDQTVPASQTVITVMLSGHDLDGDPLSYSATGQSLAYLRNQQAGGLTYHPEYDNFYGAHEKWLQAPTSTWYFIKSDGTFYQWDGSNGANGPNLGNVGTYYYTDPSRIPAAPANNPRATLTISGTTLTITRDASFVSGMVITATVSDGHTTASQSFNVFVTAGTASTSTGLSSSVNPSVSGQSVTFTATVIATPPGTGTPTGTVTFKDGTTTLGTGTLNASGVATFTISNLSVATHSITAVYGGDANFTGSTSTPVSEVVNKAGTDITMTSSFNPSGVGQSVTFTATAAAHAPGSGTPTGTVTFKEGATPLGTGTLNASGAATFTTSSLSAGSHTITASYGGDGNFNAGTAPALTQVVNTASNTPPTLDPISDQTVPGSQTVITVTLLGHDADGDTLSYSATGQSLAYLRNQQAGGLTYHPEYDNFYGVGEKWLLASDNFTWYFIKSDGTLGRWDGSNGANGTNLGNVGRSYYTDPNQIAAAPANNPRATLSISGNTLTITRDASFVSAMVITVTVNDGHGNTDIKTFTITVT